MVSLTSFLCDKSEVGVVLLICCDALSLEELLMVMAVVSLIFFWRTIFEAGVALLLFSDVLLSAKLLEAMAVVSLTSFCCAISKITAHKKQPFLFVYLNVWRIFKIFL